MFDSFFNWNKGYGDILDILLSKRECATLEKILKDKFSGKLLDISDISPIATLQAEKISRFFSADSIWWQYSLDYPQFLKSNKMWSNLFSYCGYLFATLYFRIFLSYDIF